MKTLRVSEHFYSIQGEGPSVGVPAIFVRLQGCNLNCGENGGEWVCDTLDVWKKGTSYLISDWHQFFLDTYGQYLSLGAHLIITGGEPLLQQEGLIEWLSAFEKKPFIEVETNGTILPKTKLSTFIGQWNVSPKLSNSGERITKRLKQDAMDWFLNQERAIFKFVVSDQRDVEEISNSFSKLKTLPIRRKYLMPAADTKNTLESKYKEIIQLAKKEGFSLSQRFHLSVWDQTTGV